MPLENLTRVRIESALARLSELAAAEGVRLEMTLYGGAAMMLAFDARDSTKDVDAIVHPKAIAVRLAQQVAREQNLHEGWLNDDVYQFVSTRETKHPLQVHSLEASHLRITRPTTNYLIAMKAMACRSPLPGHRGDLEDLDFLFQKAKIQTVDEVQKLVDKYFPDSPLPAPARRQMEALFKKRHEKSDT